MFMSLRKKLDKIESRMQRLRELGAASESIEEVSRYDAELAKAEIAMARVEAEITRKLVAVEERALVVHNGFCLA